MFALKIGVKVNKQAVRKLARQLGVSVRIPVTNDELVREFGSGENGPNPVIRNAVVELQDEISGAVSEGAMEILSGMKKETVRANVSEKIRKILVARGAIKDR